MKTELGNEIRTFDEEKAKSGRGFACSKNAVVLSLSELKEIVRIASQIDSEFSKSDDDTFVIDTTKGGVRRAGQSTYYRYGQNRYEMYEAGQLLKAAQSKT